MDLEFIGSIPESFSESKKSLTLAYGFKKYHDARRLLIGYKDLYDLEKLLPEMERRLVKRQSDENPDNEEVDGYKEIIEKFRGNILSKKEFLRNSDPDLFCLYENKDVFVISILDKFNLDEVNKQIQDIQSEVDSLNLGSVFYEHLHRLNGVESEFNLLNSIVGPDNTKKFFGAEVENREGAGGHVESGAQAAQHIRPSLATTDGKGLDLARRVAKVEGQASVNEEKQSNSLQRDLHAKFPYLIMGVSRVFFGESRAKSVSEAAKQDVEKWFSDKNFADSDKVSAYNNGFALVASLVALEKAGVVHQDIKPANLLDMNDGTFRVCDFGFAKFKPDLSEGDVLRGTPVFLGPEDLEVDRKYDSVSSASASASAYEYDAVTASLPTFLGKKDFVSIAYTLMHVFGQQLAEEPRLRCYSSRGDAILRFRRHYLDYGGRLADSGHGRHKCDDLPSSREDNVEIIQTLLSMSEPDYSKRGEAIEHLKVFFKQWCEHVLKNEPGVAYKSVEILKAIVDKPLRKYDNLILEAIAFNFQNPEFKKNLCVLLSNDCNFENIICDFAKDDCEPLVGIDKDLDDIKQFVGYINSKASILSKALNLRGVLEKRAFNSWKTWAEDGESRPNAIIRCKR